MARSNFTSKTEKSSESISHKKSLIRPLTISWVLIIAAIGSVVYWTNMMGDKAHKIAQELALKEQLLATKKDSNLHSIDQMTKESHHNDPVKNKNSVKDPVSHQEDLAQKTTAPIDDEEPETKDHIVTKKPDLNISKAVEIKRTPLAPVPNEALILFSKTGPLPVLGPDGLKAFKHYARPFKDTSKLPRIAILVKGVALNMRMSNAAVKSLPPEISVAISPYGKEPQKWVTKARSNGHEVFLMLPMEPLSYPANDPGPHTLMADYTVRDNIRRLKWLLSRFTGYVGVVNDMGSKFTASRKAVEPIISDLHDRGLMVFDGRTSRYSLLAKEARKIGMPRVSNTRYIDNEVNEAHILKQLKALENSARTYGASVGIMNTYPLSIKIVNQWAASLKEKGFQLVPVTAIVNRQIVK